MSEYVTVTIPESLYKQARELARVRRQSTNTIITEALAQGLVLSPPAPAIPSAAEEAVMSREMAAYEAIHAHLMAAHAGEYVAISGGQVVDYDADETALLRRVEAHFPNEVVLLKQVVPLTDGVLRIRSPRLERHTR